MREQQLFTKEFLYTKYSYVCEHCGVQQTNMLDKYITYHNENGEKKKICKACAKDFILRHAYDYLLYQGEIYHINSGLPTVFCEGCGKLMYNDGLNCYCSKCAHSKRFCPTCGKIHKKDNGICNGGLCSNYELLNKSIGNGELRMGTHRDSKSWNARGLCKVASEIQKHTMEHLPFQQERELPEKIIYELEEFYCNNDCDNADGYFDNYFYRQPTEITGTVSYKRYDGLREFKDKLSSLEAGSSMNIKDGKKPNKYRNHFFKNISDDGLITWTYVDMYGGIREKKESINKFLKENGLSEDKLSLSRKIFYRLSSDINHKFKSFIINHNLGSCQQPHNAASYAQGAYDAVTNGCNCPLLLYNSEQDCKEGKNPIGRITTRLMYNNSGKMYILVDRLYQDGSLSGSRIKGMIYKLIVEDIKKQGYNVIVTNYSAHDCSTLQYLEALGMKKGDEVKYLFQPLRRLFSVHGEDGDCGYYSDGGIEVLTTKINGLCRATDFLDKAYLLN